MNKRKFDRASMVTIVSDRNHVTFTQMAASRSTISFTEHNWKKLSETGNKSKTVNAALKFYFDSKDLIQKKEEEFILNEMQHYEDTGESYSMEETFN